MSCFGEVVGAQLDFLASEGGSCHRRFAIVLTLAIQGASERERDPKPPDPQTLKDC